MAASLKVLTGRRTISEVSLDTKTIYGILSETSVGDVATYDRLSAAIGRDVHAVWGSVATAQRMAMREIGAVFSPVRGIGLKRLSNSEIAKLSEGTLMKVRRAVGREVRRQALVDEMMLTNEEKISYSARLSMLGALVEFTKPGVAKRIEAQKPTAALPVGRVMELFR